MSNMFHKHVFNKEGRMRLIDADPVDAQAMYGHILYEDGTESLGYTRIVLGTVIKDAPTIDAEPVRHGHWIIRKYAEEVEGFLISNYECTCCHTWRREKTKFCPDCGAKMNAEEH